VWHPVASLDGMKRAPPPKVIYTDG